MMNALISGFARAAAVKSDTSKINPAIRETLSSEGTESEEMRDLIFLRPIRRAFLPLTLMKFSVSALSLLLLTSPLLAAPANDNHANATVLPTTLPATYIGQTNVGATLQPNEFSPQAGFGASVWYRFTPSRPGTLEVTTQGATFDTVLSGGFSISYENPLQSTNDDAFPGGGGYSRITMYVNPSFFYAFQVGGYNGATGSFPLNLRWLPLQVNTRATAPNVPLGNQLEYNTEADTELGEPLPSPNLQATHWYVYTAENSGQATFSTQGSSFDTMLGVYTFTPGMPALSNLLAFNDDVANGVTYSSVTVPVTVGQKFLIQAGSYANNRGELALRLSLVKKYAAQVVQVSEGLPIGNYTLLDSVTGIGEQKSYSYKLRSIGTDSLQGLSISASGPHAADLTISPLPTTLAPNAEAAFTVSFTPPALGTYVSLLGLMLPPPPFTLREADITISWTDAGTNPSFHFIYAAQVLDPAADYDNDGMNDFAEYKLASLGFDPAVSSTTKVQTLFNNANTAGLFTKSQLQGMHGGVQFAERNPVTGNFVLKLSLQKSTDLQTYTPFPLIPASTSVDAQGKLKFEFAPPSNAAFFKLSVE
jgi:hypothetical protein